MTRGRKAKLSNNSRRKKDDSYSVTGSVKTQISLEARVSRLEASVARLEARVEQTPVETNDVSIGIPAQVLEVIDGVGKRRPGPDTKIDDTELLLNRDNLVQWLEEHWPQIAIPLLIAQNPERTATVLTTIAKPCEIRPDWQSAIIHHSTELQEFLKSEKFRRKSPRKTVVDALAPYQSERRQQAANRLPTRQIANAMAGVPKIKWRTSLDKCSEIPCSYRVCDITAKYYRQVFGIAE